MDSRRSIYSNASSVWESGRSGREEGWKVICERSSSRNWMGKKIRWVGRRNFFWEIREKFLIIYYSKLWITVMSRFTYWTKEFVSIFFSLEEKLEKNFIVASIIYYSKG